MGPQPGETAREHPDDVVTAQEFSALVRELSNWNRWGRRISQRVRVGEGDILLVRTGHSRRLAEVGPWDTRESKAGLHPTALRFDASRAVAVLGSDGNSDITPKHYRGGRLSDSRARDRRDGFARVGLPPVRL